MTITTTDSADSGEVARLVGEERTVIIRRDTVGEATRNLAHDIAGLPPRRRPAADETVTQMRLIEPALGLNHHDMDRVVEMDETVIYRIPETIGIVDTDRLTILDSLAGSYADMDGELQGPQPKPTQPLPPDPRPAAPGRASFTVRGMVRQGRHRAPAPLRYYVSIAVGALLIGGGVGLFVLWAVAR